MPHTNGTESDSTPVEFTLDRAASIVAAAIPDREMIVQGDRRFTFAQVDERARRFASFLHSQGLGCHTERADLAPHEVGQDLLGCLAYNGNEYIEGLLGAFRARVAPFNVNYRYTGSELAQLLANSEATALVYHAAFAPTVAAVRSSLPSLRVLIQIADGSGNELLDGAVDYETVLAGSSPEPLPIRSTPDDLYVLYTGGTTGMPKGVLWRQHDILMAGCGGRNIYNGELVDSYERIAANAVANPGLRMMILPPLMHGAAQWAALTAALTGQTVIFSTVPDHLDGPEVVRTIEREKVAVVTVVGDAMARPLAAAIEDGDADVSSLVLVGNGGAVLSPTAKERLIAAMPGVVVLDGVGSSETGAQMQHTSMTGAVATGTFRGGPDTCVVAEDLDGVLEPGHDGIGWLAQRGFAPLGYKGDAAKTAATFPVIGSIRYALPGDRARHLADGSIELLGRDSATINSGGEKIFAEEVELAIVSHPDVVDVVVAARPSERWGQEVVAIVVPAEDAELDAAGVIEHAARSIARYKLPKAVVFRSEIARSPAGKADYRWARAQAVADDARTVDDTNTARESVR
ncbi:acyl-CoA synthetase [Rhodococcus sp. NPDC003383]